MPTLFSSGRHLHSFNLSTITTSQPRAYTLCLSLSNPSISIRQTLKAPHADLQSTRTPISLDGWIDTIQEIQALIKAKEHIHCPPQTPTTPIMKRDKR